MEQLYKGRTPQEDYEQLIEMLDTVFFTFDKEVPQREFLALLPKLYKKEYDPCHNNFAVKDSEGLCAAVGSYYSTLHVGEETLKLNGIGNVAVTLEHRSKGYMKDCMNLALEDMKAEGADLSDLGGQKQRYEYFGYEPAGLDLDFRVSTTNIRHCCGADAKSGLLVKKLNANDADILAQIDALSRSGLHYVERAPQAMFDILCSWRCAPYAAFDGARFVGYFVLSRGGDSCSELKAVQESELQRMILAVLETAEAKSVGITVSPFDLALQNVLLPLCEGYSLDHAHQYNVLCYENVIRAFLKAKASRYPLCDGEIVLLIHGFNGEEQLKIAVKGNAVSVAKTTQAPAMELAHLDATRLLFSLHCNERSKLPAQVEQWLPIPLFGYGTDAV